MMMKRKNMLMSAAALGAVYLLRNKDARDKLMNGVQNYISPEKIEKMKNSVQSMINPKNGEQPEKFAGSQAESSKMNNDSSEIEKASKAQDQALLGTDFAQKDEDESHSLAEAPKL
ncbi:hypothetical protein [Bacillus sp. MUM 13]|uniref:hypothetical protein n=1 Tax=Bacillus sp. MUM 13 TaxID=1678001 RepID=UPI0008F5EA34|nr:hypothetical protein [Bacillus sp. MUM 13]OIK12715.1 hypothetical protein BIV59_07785 [Bacillus sp. MUM 13]